MPQHANSADQDFVNELLSRQDSVISELEKLESEILNTIESLNLARQEQLQPEPSSGLDSNTIRMSLPEDSSDDDRQQSSRAA